MNQILSTGPLSGPPARTWVGLTAVVFVLLAGCSPRVQVEAPEKPITINLNVKIQHEILVKVDKEIDSLLEQNSELF